MLNEKHDRGEFALNILRILVDHPGGIAAKDVLTELARRMPPTPFEAADYPNRPGVRRFEKMARFSTIAPVKASWLTKINGIWAITEKGRQILNEYSDPLALHAEMHKHWVAWKETHPGEKGLKKKKSADREVKKAVPAWMDFIPPVIAKFPEMARDSSRAGEFEQAVMLLFRLLGYRVENYGQGTGRQPDGVAIARESHYAILFDAKSSREGYSLGTDDRKIVEYIQVHKKRLIKEGFEKFYFVLLSSAFRGDMKAALLRIRQQTGVQSVVFLTAEQALRLLAHRISDPLAFDLDSLEPLFMDSGPVSEDELNDLLEQG